MGRVLIGVVVSNFEIVARIGEGGMGAVYLARHPVIGRQVAIKVLRPELCTDEVQVNRFANEARAASAIRHPGIIEVLDFGLMPDGARPYLMMEYLGGESLAARLRRGRATVAEAVEVGRQTAEALHAAHTAGIIHRDLKPDNVVLVPDEALPGGVRVKVLDFGIAKLSDDMGGTSVKTRSGVVFGTPVYMSPEQCQGRRGRIDARSDVYALGVMLYEMVCGRPPFAGDGVTEILLMHATARPTPIRKLNATVPPALESVIMQALAKHPEDRQASMAQLAAQLDAVAQAGFGLAPRRRWLGLVALGGSAAVTATVVLLVAAARERPRAPTAPPKHTVPRPAPTFAPMARRPPTPTPFDAAAPAPAPPRHKRTARVRTAAPVDPGRAPARVDGGRTTDRPPGKTPKW